MKATLGHHTLPNVPLCVRSTSLWFMSDWPISRWTNVDAITSNISSCFCLNCDRRMDYVKCRKRNVFGYSCRLESVGRRKTHALLSVQRWQPVTWLTDLAKRDRVPVQGRVITCDWSSSYGVIRLWFRHAGKHACGRRRSLASVFRGVITITDRSGVLRCRSMNGPNNSGEFFYQSRTTHTS